MIVQPFSAKREADVLQVVNTYTQTWPYSRPLGPDLLTYWKTLGKRHQPDHMLIAYSNGIARAFAHGEQQDDVHNLHLLAATPDGVEEAALLLQAVEEQARSHGAQRLYGPRCAAQAFYGGYVLGAEPYHPHWATAVTDLYVQAGFAMTQCDVLMSGQCHANAVEVAGPPGYELVETTATPEFGARTFRFAATVDGLEVSTCTGRLYCRLRNASGGVVGQLGPVGTHEAHRGRGLATALVRLSLGRLGEWGAGEALVSTGLENDAALRVYEKAGFRRKHSINEWSKALT
jgi:ribosomal protein S18 acetylase RimI-like enzyme